MNLILALALSTLVSVTGWLNDGLKALEKKDYDAAIENFSRITKENSAGTRFYELSLYHKALAYQGKGDKDKAVAELTTLLKGECGKELRAEGKKLYVELGGKPEKLLPDESPKKVWEKFMDLMANDKTNEALELATGQWKTTLQQLQNMAARGMNNQGLSAMVNQMAGGGVGDESIPEDPDKENATLQIKGVHNGMLDIKMTFVLDRESNRWLINSYLPEPRGGRINGPVQGGQKKENETTGNLSKLKQIGLGCRMYSQEHKEKFPNGFDELISGGYLENKEMYVWISPQDGSKEKFIYCPGHTESSSVDYMLAAAPRAANGKREVLYMDGHASSITEEEFQKTAKEQGWKVPLVPRFEKKDIPEEKQKQIRDLVAKLGDQKAEERQDAKKKLIEMGAEAYPVLEEFSNHRDPEIKMAVRELLKGK